MVRIILAILISLYSISTFAKISKEQLLNISLENTGAVSCYLQNYEIKNGKLYKSKVPTTLSYSGESEIFTIYGKVAELTLTYECEQDKNITIYMKKYFKKFGDATILSAVLSAKDVFATHENKPGYMRCTNPINFPVQCFTKQSAINWKFSN